MTICCLGDLLLDVIVRLEQPLATGADATARTVLRPGGQAANVAAWVAALGGRARFVGKRGDDDAGGSRRARLRELGVELVGPVEPAGNGVIVSLVAPDGERTMCPDRGVAPELRPDEIDAAWFAGCATCTSRAMRCCASRSASPRRARSSARARTGRASASTSRRGARSATSGASVPRRARGARAGRRLRQRGRGRDRRRADRRRRLDPQARRRRLLVRRRRACRRCPSRRRRHDRRRRRPRGRLARRGPELALDGRRTLRRSTPGRCRTPVV